MVGTDPPPPPGDVAPDRLHRLGSRIPLSLQVAGLTGSVAAGQGVTALLTAKWLGASDRGVLAVAQTVSMLLVLFGGLGLVQGTRVLLADERRGVTLRGYARGSRWLVVIQVTLACTVGVVAFLRLADLDQWVYAAAFVVLTTSAFRASLLREALHGIGWHRLAVTSEAVAALLPLVVITVAQLTGRLTLLLAFFALVAGAVAQWSLQAAAIRRAYSTLPAASPPDPAHAPERESSFALAKRMVVFSLPGLVGAIGLAAAGRMDRIILAIFHDTASVGIYATAATLADLPWVLPLSIAPIITRGVARTQSTAIHGVWWIRVMAATLGLTVFTWLGGWLLMERFLGADFHGQGILLAVLLVGSLGIASQQVDLAVCAGLGDLRAGARAATWGAVLGLTAYLVLIPPFGAMGAAIGTVVTYVSMSVVARMGLRRHLRAGGTTS